MSVEDVKPGAQQCLVLAVLPTLTHDAGDCRSSRPFRFGVKGASSAISAGIAIAVVTGARSPKRTVERMVKDFILIECDEM